MRPCHLRRMAAAALALAPAPVGAQSPGPFAGHWVGAIEARGKKQFVTLTLAGDSAVVALPLDGFAASCAELRLEAKRLRCTTRDPAIVLTAQPAGDGLDVLVETAGRGARGSFARAVELPDGALAAYRGVYRFRDGHELLVDTYPDIPNTLLVTDVRTGQVRGFQPLGGGRFFAGPALLVPAPREQALAFDTSGGRVAGLRLQRAMRRVERAARVELRAEEVRFANGRVTLAGTLLLPPRARGRVPAVVFTHGGGPARREWFWGLGYLFAARGFAVLAYDKRGVGESTGSWRDASFDDLAGDAAAAAAYLRSRADVRADGIGFWGISQGGWIAPLAAARFRGAAFAIALSGGGISPAGQELIDTGYELRAAGIAPAAVEQALRFQRLRNEYALHGTGWDAYAAAVRSAQGQPWFRFPGTDTWGPATADDPYWTRIRRFYFYDPAPALRALHAPLLALFGGMDSPPGPWINADSMRAALRAGGRRNYDVRVYPAARHNLMEVPRDAPGEFVGVRRFVPGLFDAMVEGARARVGRAQG